MKHWNIEIYGRVQGVAFRHHTTEQAQRWGITGFVQNCSDGSVYIEAEAKEAALDQFLEWCHHGPSFAKVRKVAVTENSLQGYSTFEIRY